MIIAIDGPVGTGKSSVAKRLAKKIGFIHFDTGAMYRCLTYGIIKEKIPYQNSGALQRFLDRFSFEIKVVDGEKRYFVDGEDVSDQIRQEKVTNLVSQVAALPEVRKKLVSYQQKAGHGRDSVFEGRDIGTVVFPDAEVKIFLTASPEVRAERRLEEWRTKFPELMENMTLEKMIEEVNRRDALDTNRKVSPLKKADDAHMVDTSDLTIEEVVDHILAYVDHARNH